MVIETQFSGFAELQNSKQLFLKNVYCIGLFVKTVVLHHRVQFAITILIFNLEYKQTRYVGLVWRENVSVARKVDLFI